MSGRRRTAGAHRAARVAAAAALGASCAASTPANRGPRLGVPAPTSALVEAMWKRAGAPPATAAILTEDDPSLEGPLASGEPGDYLLQNDAIVAVIRRIDGDQAGKLVDLARASGRMDGLDELRTAIGGVPIEYTAIRHATTPTLAWVEVDGRAGESSVVTHYEVRAGLDAVLIHTELTRPKTIATDVFIADRLVGEPEAVASCRGDIANDQCDLCGELAGYELFALASQGVVTGRAHGAMILGIESASAVPGTNVYSRLVAPLERPDSLAVATAVAVARGQAVGEVELRVDQAEASGARIIDPGHFYFFGASGSGTSTVSLLMPRRAPLNRGDHVVASIPAGSWQVGYVSEAYRSSEIPQDPLLVRPAERAKLRLLVSPSPPIR